ncbi:MAG: hypothetical protein CL840_21035 [Crocinitomicaceae bacterium]|nr:hypothetical protein [Crocinitomicaceae bacterium]
MAPAFSQINFKHQSNRSFTYQEAIDNFKILADEYAEIELVETNYLTDVGRPLHVVVYNNDKKFKPGEIDRNKKTVLFINNAIHPGESCGVDASVKLFSDLGKFHKLYPNVVVVCIPVYNIGGMLNRSKYNRSAQPGPVECGFRGNYQNLDLNRDFIKTDALNTEGFVQLFQQWNPNLFMDTHTTNGSDHQYTITLITSQKDKMNPELKNYVYGKMEPMLYSEMKKKNVEMIPYVYSINKTPDKGIKDFLETPRYSSGYANLFNCISFISEAHKYKSFNGRVEQTYELLKYLCEYATRNTNDLIEVKRRADEYSKNQKDFYLTWSLDTSKSQKLPFKGYALESKKSDVTGQAMIHYNRDKKVDMEIPYFREYVAADRVDAPDYYVIPQCYRSVAKRLELNGVEVKVIDRDTILNGEMYRIDNFHSIKSPYEKHFMHDHIHVTPSKQSIQFYKGDYLVSTNQKNKRFIVEVLEPHASDSYFRWNFFDNILQQKEWFSDFGFDPVAKDLLVNDENLKKSFEEKRNSDTTFAKNHFQQLYWIFLRSPYYEKTHRRYPVMRYFE